MTNITAAITHNKRSLKDRVTRKPRFTITLQADGRDTTIGFGARHYAEAQDAQDHLEWNGIEILEDLGMLDDIRRETFRIKHHLDPLPAYGDKVELTVDIGEAYPKGTAMRVHGSSYVMDIKSEENRYPVTLLPEDEWETSLGKNPETILGIPVSIDEYKVLETKLVAA